MIKPKELEAIVNGLTNLAKIQVQFAEYQRVHFQAKPPEFFCLELNGEAGELANLEKKIWKGGEKQMNLINDEAADVFIALMNYCNAREINLSKAVEDKLGIIEQKRSKLKEEGKSY